MESHGRMIAIKACSSLEVTPCVNEIAVNDCYHLCCAMGSDVATRVVGRSRTMQRRRWEGALE
ncbi:alpha/beta hydrolase [Sesbania bispinosa]|nr:alpha/beta hydrolase [Sesbania bispinosa]